MTVWRLVRRDRIGLDGEGARLYGGRWNSPGTAVIYTAGTLSLAVLEYLVHLNPDKLPHDLVSIAGDIPDTLAIDHVAIEILPRNWNDVTLQPVTQSIGTQWVTAGHSAVLKVPSAVIPQESNYVLNPRHTEFSAITWSVPEPFGFDRRLLS
jgi:RES domain-containing protein